MSSSTYGNLLQLSGYFEHSGRRGDHLCLVMDLMAEDAHTFAHCCDKDRLPLRLAKQVSKDILLGLQYLHNACNIIHTGVSIVLCPHCIGLTCHPEYTDIKPSNILLAPRQWGQLIDQLPPISVDEKDGIQTLQSQPITLNGSVDKIRAVLVDFGVCESKSYPIL